jgi:hypothetical protein
VRCGGRCCGRVWNQALATFEWLGRRARGTADARQGYLAEPNPTGSVPHEGKDDPGNKQRLGGSLSHCAKSLSSNFLQRINRVWVNLQKQKKIKKLLSVAALTVAL